MKTFAASSKTVLSNAALGVVGVALVSTMVVRASSAAFTGTTDTDNNWAAGTVALSDDDVSNATFSVDKMTPTESGSECVNVTYGGTADVNTGQTVKLYTSALTDTDGGIHNTASTPAHLTLSDDLMVTVTVYAAGQTCATPSAELTAAATTGSVTLASFGDDFSAGFDSLWTPNPETGTDTARAFKIDYLLPSATGNDAQADRVDATFTWEIRSNA